MVKQEVSYLWFNVNYVDTQHLVVEFLKRFCRYLAMIFNSTVIEMYGDKIRVSHGFEDCQMLK